MSNPWMRKKQVANLIVGILTTLGVCHIAKSQDSNIAVYDTGIRARGSLLKADIYWISNEEVLFAGHDPSRKVDEGSTLVDQMVLRVLNVRTKAARIYSDIPSTDYVCFSDGFISYGIRRGSERLIREGRLGGETERKWTPDEGSKFDRSEITCRNVAFSDLTQVYRGTRYVVRSLRADDGYLATPKGEAYYAGPLFYWAGDGVRLVQLPILAEQWRRISYSAFAKAYVLEKEDNIPRRSGLGSKVWLLYPGGKVTEYDVPEGPWLRATWGFGFTRAGWIFTSVGSDHGGADYTGVNLVQKGLVRRLISGAAGLPSVSADGCTVAVAVSPLDGSVRGTLRIINLCGVGKS